MQIFKQLEDIADTIHQELPDEEVLKDLTALRRLLLENEPFYIFCSEEQDKSAEQNENHLHSNIMLFMLYFVNCVVRDIWANLNTDSLLFHLHDMTRQNAQLARQLARCIKDMAAYCKHRRHTEHTEIDMTDAEKVLKSSGELINKLYTILKDVEEQSLKTYRGDN